ncbi:MAG: glycoside hydrolase family 113 [Peptostreptococcaceae bacterium]
MKINKRIIVVAIVFLFFSLAIIFAQSGLRENNYSEKLKSINLATDYEIDQVLKDIKLVDCNTVNVPVVINIPNTKSNNLQIDEYSKEKAIKLIKILNKKNINVILEAFPWINNGSEYETEYNPENKNQFFRDWKGVLSTLVNDIANPYNVDVMNVASNFVMLESYEDSWCDIISYVREIYNGQITYKTSWWYTASWDEESLIRYENKLNNKLFSKVDFISIASYFELSEKATNTVDELTNALRGTTIHNRNQNIEQEIKNFYDKYKKPIFFGELGFPRTENAATQPWNHLVSDIENDEEQARCFESYKRVFKDADYIKGFSVFAMGNKGEDKLYYPSKQSIKVISSW